MKKKIIATTMTLSLALSMAVSGMELWHAKTGRSGAKVYVEAAFDSSAKTSDSAYCKKIGLKADKYVKSVKIRLKEGDYDKSKTSTTGQLVKLSKINNPFNEASGTWTWSYK